MLFFGKPLSPLPRHQIYALGGLMALATFGSLAGSKWGTSIRVAEDGIGLMKEGSPIQTFEWARVKSLKCNKNTINIYLKPGTKPLAVVIGKSGFSGGTWSSLKSCVSSHFGTGSKA